MKNWLNLPKCLLKKWFLCEVSKIKWKKKIFWIEIGESHFGGGHFMFYLTGLDSSISIQTVTRQKSIVFVFSRAVPFYQREKNYFFFSRKIHTETKHKLFMIKSDCRISCCTFISSD